MRQEFEHPPPLLSRSLNELLVLVAQRHRGAFVELYDRSAPGVLAVATALVRNSSYAEEVTQDVYLEIWQKAHQFDPARGSASSWICRIAHSRSVDRVRSTNAARIRDDNFARLSSRLAVRDDVVTDVLRHADRELLHFALAGLSQLQREAITTTYLMDHNYRQASCILGVPLSTLKTRVRDGLQALRATAPTAAG